MSFWDYVGAANQGVAGALQGRNAAQQQAWQNKMEEDTLALRRYALEQEQAQRDQQWSAEGPLRAAQAKYYLHQADQPVQHENLDPNDPQVHRQIRKIDAQFPTWDEQQQRQEQQRKQKEREDNEDSAGRAILEQYDPDYKRNQSTSTQQGFGGAFQTVRSAHPDWSPGRVAYHAYHGMLEARPDLKPRIDALGNRVSGNLPQPPAPGQPADGAHVTQPGVGNRVGGGTNQAPAEHHPQGLMGWLKPNSNNISDDADVQQRRQDWDNLSAVYGQEETTRQIGPRP